MVELSDDDKCKSEHAAVEVAQECFFIIHTTNINLIGDHRPQQHCPSKMWRELKDWKSNWKKSTFFQALVFGLAASFFDCGTDFYFAWTVPGDCSQDCQDC